MDIEEELKRVTDQRDQLRDDLIAYHNAIKEIMERLRGIEKWENRIIAKHIFKKEAENDRLESKTN